jgi:hypothetical protein
MQKYARIENGAVVETIETDDDIAQMFHPAMLWIVCAAGVFERWIYDGTSFSPPPTPPAPTIDQIRDAMQCQAWQLRRALTLLGLRTDVEASVAAADQDTSDMWNYATVYHRTHPMVAAIAAAIGKTDADIDALFDLAMTIN